MTKKTKDVTEFDNSRSDFVNNAREAFDRWMSPQNVNGEMHAWATDIFDDHVVARQDKKYFRVPMTVDDETFTFAPRGEWEPVRLSYVAEMSDGLEPIFEIVIADYGAQNPPDIPTAPGVDMAELVKGDDKPFFITQPLAPDGTVSKNGLLYDAALGESIVNQIMADKPGGIMGHIPPDKQSSSFPVSEVHWIGAVRHDNQSWVKGYIPKTFPQVREDYRIEKAKGGKAATSITGGVVREIVDRGKNTWRAKTFKLERLDLAPPKRAAAPSSGAFTLTSEMETGDPDPSTDKGNEKEEKTMPDKKELLAGLTAEDIKALPQFEAVRELIITEHSASAETTQQITELTADNETKTTRITELEAEQDAQKLTIQEFEAVRFGVDFDAKISELTNWKVSGDEHQKALDSLRGVIKSMALAKLGDVREMDQAGTTLNELAKGEMKALIEMTRERLAGPAAIVPGSDNRNGNDSDMDVSPEATQKSVDTFAFRKG